MSWSWLDHRGSWLRGLDSGDDRGERWTVKSGWVTMFVFQFAELGLNTISCTTEAGEFRGEGLIEDLVSASCSRFRAVTWIFRGSLTGTWK